MAKHRLLFLLFAELILQTAFIQIVVYDVDSFAIGENRQLAGEGFADFVKGCLLLFGTNREAGGGEGAGIESFRFSPFPKSGS